MQDHFLEEVVIKHKNGLNRALYMISWVMIVVTGILALLSFSAVTSGITTGRFNWMDLVMLVVCGGICAYTFFFHDKIRKGNPWGA